MAVGRGGAGWSVPTSECLLTTKFALKKKKNPQEIYLDTLMPKVDKWILISFSNNSPLGQTR